MGRRRLHERLQRLALARTEDELASLLRAEAEELGYGSFIYALRAPTSFAEARVVQIRGYPDAWLERYWERAYYAVDPVVAYCSRHVVAVEWDSLVPEMSSASRRMMNEAGDVGLATGVTMPVHGPGGELGILSFARRERGRSRAATRRALAEVPVIAGHLHEAVLRVANLDGEAPTAPLSAREQDCLRWAAGGKTSWEISRLFNISERTVNFHFDNSVAKLRAANRQHAIARAITSRIVRPRPF